MEPLSYKLMEERKVILFRALKQFKPLFLVMLVIKIIVNPFDNKPSKLAMKNYK